MITKHLLQTYFLVSIVHLIKVRLNGLVLKFKIPAHAFLRIEFFIWGRSNNKVHISHNDSNRHYQSCHSIAVGDKNSLGEGANKPLFEYFSFAQISRI